MKTILAPAEISVQDHFCGEIKEDGEKIPCQFLFVITDMEGSRIQRHYAADTLDVPVTARDFHYAECRLFNVFLHELNQPTDRAFRCLECMNAPSPKCTDDVFIPNGTHQTRYIDGKTPK